MSAAAPIDNDDRRAALRFFPVHDVAGGKCSCGKADCIKNAGKHPRIDGWQQFATDDEQVIRGWRRTWPDMNVGVTTGRASSIVVLDVDPRNGGDATLAALEAEHGPLPPTPTVLTGGGGLHYYFAYPTDGEEVTGRSGRVGSGLDVKSGGGYVVAPPSVHRSGRAYEWKPGAGLEDVALAAIPDWLLALMRSAPASGNGNGKFDRERAMAGVPEGERDETMNGLAWAERSLGHSEEEALKNVLTAASNCEPPFSPKDAETKVRRAYRSTKFTPKATRISPARLADEIVAEDHFAQDAGGWLYVYKDGVYRPVGAEHVRYKVRQIVSAEKPAQWSSRLGNEAAEYIRIASPRLWEKPPIDRINVANGVYDLRSGRLQPHSPDHLSTIQLPFNYDAGATCPDWDRQIEETFEDDAIQAAWEITGTIIIPFTGLQKAVMLVGLGGNGKGTITRAWTALVGFENTSSLTLQRIENEKFSAALLVGRLVNICADLPSERLTHSSMFKAITGNDAITGEYKHKPPFTFVPFVRLIFSTNKMPESDDASEAWFQRWIVLNFPHLYRDTTRDIKPHILDPRLAAPGELSGALNRALKALPAVVKQGIKLSASMEKASDEFRTTTDPFGAWLDECTVEGSELWVSKAAMIRAYNYWAHENEKSSMDGTAFGLAMKHHRPNIADCQRTVAGQPRTWCYKSIGLKIDDGVM